MPQVKTIAVTRPRADGEAMCAKLTQYGHKAFHVPMLTIEPVQGSQQKLAELLTLPLQAICVTSKHAVRALAGQPRAHTLPLFAVGQATAQEASRAGFTSVIPAHDNAASLMALMLDNCKRDKGAILYLRGMEVTRDIAAELTAHSFSALQLVVYEAEPVASFPAGYSDALIKNAIDEVWFFSRASAANYVQITLSAGLSECHRRIMAQCVSDHVAAALTPFAWDGCRVVPVILMGAA